MRRRGPLRLCVVFAFLAGGVGAESTLPALRASIGGSSVPAGLRHQIVVEQETDQPAMATLTVAGRKGRDFVGGVHAGDDVRVGTGPESPSLPIFTGEVISIEDVPDSRGERTAIRAFNRLHRLAREPKTRDFLDVTDAEIVEVVATENGLVPAPDPELHQRYDHVFQHNQTDLEFLLERAARIGYEVFAEDTKLFFRKREVAPPLVLAPPRAAGDSRLRRFHPRLSSTRTVQQVVVRGFDPERHPVIGKAALPTILLEAGDPDPDLVLGRTIELTVDEPISSEEEANAIAKAKLEARSLSYITGEAEATGSPQLRAGRLVVFIGMGDRFDGRYYVAGVSHRYSHALGCGGGYKSRLKIRRQPLALFFLPEIDDEVLVAFENGDLDRPFVVGSLWDDDADCRDRPPRVF